MEMGVMSMDLVNDENCLYIGIFVTPDNLFIDDVDLDQAASKEQSSALNSCMENSTYLQSIYENVKSLGVVRSQYAFARLCGRKNSWFSAVKSRNRPMAIAAMISLVINLERLPSDVMSSIGKQRVIELAETLWLLIESRAVSDPKQRRVLRYSRGRSISQEC